MASKDKSDKQGAGADDYTRWLNEAEAIGGTQNPLSIPYDTFVREAAGLGAFVDKYWEPAGGLPGLKSLKKRLPPSTSQDLRSQIRGLQESQTRLLLTVDPVVIDKGERARFVIDELESALEFLLDDDVQESADDQLVKMQEFHAQDGQRSSALSQSLLDYAALADTLKDRLVEVDGDFDVKLIAEGRKLAAELTTAPKPPQDPSASLSATRIRNGFLSLVLGTVRRVRSAAKRRFRAQPEIIREATSGYERRRRAAARRAKQKSAGDKPPAGGE